MKHQLLKSLHSFYYCDMQQKGQLSQVLKINNDNLYSWIWIRQFTADQVLFKIVISGQVFMFELPLHFPL